MRYPSLSALALGALVSLGACAHDKHSGGIQAKAGNAALAQFDIILDSSVDRYE